MSTQRLLPPVCLATMFALALTVLPLEASTTTSAVKLFADSDVGPELLVYSLTHRVELVNDSGIVVPLKRFVDGIALTMGLPAPVRLIVMRHSQPEALSAPPNYFLITTGMLASVSSDDQLAGVVARELSHIQLRHPIRSVSRFRMERRGQDEYAADRAAVSFLASAGYDPQQFPGFLRKLAEENAAAAYLADRPDISLRLMGLESHPATTTVTKGQSFTVRPRRIHGEPRLSPAVAELLGSVHELYPPHRRPRNHPAVTNISTVFGQ